MFGSQILAEIGFNDILAKGILIPACDPGSLNTYAEGLSIHMDLSYLTKMNASLTDLVMDFHIAHVIYGGELVLTIMLAADDVESRHAWVR